MAVIVTSSVTKDGDATVAGDIVRIVLVKTGRVFGTGTIVGILSQ